MHDHDSRPLLLITRKMNDIRARGNEKALTKEVILYLIQYCLYNFIHSRCLLVRQEKQNWVISDKRILVDSSGMNIKLVGSEKSKVFTGEAIRAPQMFNKKITAKLSS